MPNVTEALKDAVRTSGRKIIEMLPLGPDNKVRLKFLAFALAGPILGVRRSKPQDAEARVRSVGERYRELSATARGLPGGIPERSVSIVIPVHNQLSYTLRCLDAVERNTGEIDHEIVVVDDASTDETEAALSGRDGIVYVRNERNLGFVGSCNAGAARASKTYLCFLNNDTVVQPFWLSALVNTFELHPHTGLAGSKLVFPDGRLQEAGGLVWADGSAWNWGRLQNPENPRYRYARCTDYCSGASILIPRALFDGLGGFDTHYAPAYAEDTDLAFKVRALGLATVYQPLSQVIHFEGVTSGTDTSQGVKKHQVENLRKLARRWAPVLEHQGRSEDADIVCDRGVTGRVLILDQITPEPDRDAGSLALLEIFHAFRTLGYKITFVPCSNLSDMPPYTDLLSSLGIESVLLPWTSSLGRHLKKFGSGYDAVMIFRPATWQAYIGKIRKFAPQAKIIFHACDLHFLRHQREAQIAGRLSAPEIAGLDAAKEVELDMIAGADLCTLHSPVEKDLVEAERPGTKVVVIPIIYEPKGRGRPMDERSGILFVGGYRHPPNVDAVSYYLSDIHPLVKETLPDRVNFTAAGDSPPALLLDRAGPGISVPGFIEDIEPLLNEARVMVAPLRFGAGVKGKILTALAHGLPVVTTSIGAEGIGEGDEMLVADDAKSFADAVCRLYTDGALWHRLQEEGLAYLRENTSRDVAIRAVADVLRQLGLPYMAHRLPSPGGTVQESGFGSETVFGDIGALVEAGRRILPDAQTPDLIVVPDAAVAADARSGLGSAICGYADAESRLPKARAVVAVADPTDAASVDTLGRVLGDRLPSSAPCAVVVAPPRLVADRAGYALKTPFDDDGVDRVELPFHETLNGALSPGDRDCSWHIDTSLSGFPALAILRIA